jgi:hypothetical protein
MYKPLFLGINNADPVVAYGLLILIFCGLISAAGLILYFTGYYMIKLFSLIHRKSRRFQK